MQKITRDQLIDKAVSLLENGTVEAVLGWGKGEFDYDVTPTVFKTADDYMRIFDEIDRKLGAEVACNLHCHFSKIEWTDKGEKKHLTFADEIYGPDYEPLIEAIAKHSLSPTIISESAGTQSDDALAMKKYYLERLNK